MAFSKSKSKRFNETLSCAPPVGKYDVTTQQKAVVGCFDKSERFKMPTEPLNCSSILRPAMSMDSLLLEKTPVKKLFENGVKNTAKMKRSSTPCQVDVNKKISELEKEIKHLLLQRTEQDKLLSKRQSEVQKLDSRLQSTLQEKSGLEASLATAEKELASVRKAKDVLMNKVDTAEGNIHKKHEEMQSKIQEAENKLIDKEKEVNKLQDELTCQVRHLQADLEEAASKMLALEETKTIQEQLTKDAKIYSEEIESQVGQLQGVISQLRAENTHFQQQVTDVSSKNEMLSIENCDLKDAITEAKEDLANARESVTKLSQEDELASKQIKQAQQMVRELQQQLTDADSRTEALDEDIRSSEKRLEEEILRADNAVNQVTMVTEKLEMTENMMNENLKALSTKYQLLEEDYTTCQMERQQETEQLKFELDAVNSASAELETEQDNLQKGNVELIESLEKHREIGIKLQGQLVAAEQQIENTRKQFDELKEQSENDFIVLNCAKNHLLTLNNDLEEKINSLEDENRLLHTDLSRHAETFEEMTKDKVLLLNKMSDLSVQKQNLLENKQKLIKESEICQEQINKLQKDSENLRKEKELAFESKMSQEKEMSRQLHSVQDELQKVKQEFGKRIVDTQTKCSSKEAEVERLNQQIDTLEENIENAMHEQNRVQCFADDVQQEKDALCGRIARMEAVHNSNLIEYEKQQKIYQEKLNNIEKELVETEESKHTMEKEMETRLKGEVMALKEKYKKRIVTMQEKNTEMEAQVHRLEENFQLSQEHLQTEKGNTKQLVKSNQKLTDERSTLTYKLNHLETTNKSLENDVQAWSSQVHLVTCEKQALTARISDNEKENCTLSNTISDLQEAAVNHVCNDENTEAMEEEILRWQTLYEELHEKVAPFKEQLDQFELERKFLLCKSSQAQSEIQKLSQDYAKLLGHQNSKQKIQHVQKLKQENLALKQEVTKLREQNVKYLRQMKSAGDKNPSRKRFTPSEAFKSTKENAVPLGPHN